MTGSERDDGSRRHVLLCSYTRRTAASLRGRPLPSLHVDYLCVRYAKTARERMERGNAARAGDSGTGHESELMTARYERQKRGAVLSCETTNQCDYYDDDYDADDVNSPAGLNFEMLVPLAA